MKKYFVIMFVLTFLVFGLTAGDNFVALSSESQFNTLTANKLVFIDFYADWCGPCRTFAPVFKEVSESLSGYTFIKIDTDQFGALSGKFNVKYIPHIVATFNGKEVAKFEGSRNATAYKTWCEEQIKAHGGNTSTTTNYSSSSTATTTSDSMVYIYEKGPEKGYIGLASNDSKKWVHVSDNGICLILEEYKVDENYYYLEDVATTTKYAVPTSASGDYYKWTGSEWVILYSVTKK